MNHSTRFLLCSTFLAAFSIAHAMEKVLTIQSKIYEMVIRLDKNIIGFDHNVLNDVIELIKATNEDALSQVGGFQETILHSILSSIPPNSTTPALYALILSRYSFLLETLKTKLGNERWNRLLYEKNGKLCCPLTTFEQMINSQTGDPNPYLQELAQYFTLQPDPGVSIPSHQSNSLPTPLNTLTDKDIAEKIMQMVSVGVDLENTSMRPIKFNKDKYNEIVKYIQNSDSEKISSNILHNIISALSAYNIEATDLALHKEIINAYRRLLNGLKEKLGPPNWNKLLEQLNTYGETVPVVLNYCARQQSFEPTPYLNALADDFLNPQPVSLSNNSVEQPAVNPLKTTGLKKERIEEKKAKVTDSKTAAVQTSSLGTSSSIIGKFLLLSGITATVCVLGFFAWKLTSSDEQEEEESFVNVPRRE